MLPIFRSTMSKSVPKSIRSAACLIIGDEVLNGKILDTNSHEFAKVCFNRLSIPLRKTIVCGDDTEDIIRSIKVLRQEGYDLLVTSGGIGPTHDDITYEAIATAYDLKCEIDSSVKDRMQQLRNDYISTLSAQQADAFYRMATIPQATEKISVEKIYCDDSLWVPIVGIDEQVYILPGVPQLFKKLLDYLADHIKGRLESNIQHRFFIRTDTKESELAPFLSQLQGRCNSEFGINAVKLGSYPHFNWNMNTISVIGDSNIAQDRLKLIVKEIISSIGGAAHEISQEEEDRLTTSDPN
ncbi:hypothetical protein PGUG_00222 [Meyerozyma guilliermondii ATCC 6260]|uniref:MoaB/Mog domain-containing protein n=1 Tax=Meyerozyma guilliermondii (strain ATCC 6260 / CBS 566 / DSM 6381 / JCM 1539 / NBRC 10279 / NRRL Y-324) TaxID=294746 RepID=A5DAB7_PICGU|nr:uncharacterized protein PGUG_00222 [Meyerozyma guilliermondii ATCC 6260]EDK36124.2 hypothetical protein PGUG_00222 [Meyerozyma guilliermondii ATCC 6260]